MTAPLRQLATSPDGRWAIARSGREVMLYGRDSRKRLELDRDGVELALLRPPDALVAIARDGDRTHVELREPPSLEVVAKVELDAPARLAAITGPRLALIAADNRHLAIVKIAPRALAHVAIDAAGIVEFVVGLERDQLLLGMPKNELKVWDAIAARPLLKLQLQLPPGKRTVGIAAGHLWATRPGSDELFVYRLSDGRPFHHRVGAPVDEVVSHPASPILVLATPRGLARLHCLSHSVTPIERAPWQPPADGAPRPPLAQLVLGDDISLLGLPDDGLEPWRVPIGGGAGPATLPAAGKPATTPTISAALPIAREPEAPPARPTPRPEPQKPAVPWREQLLVYAEQIAAGGYVGEPPKLAQTGAPCELVTLAERLALGDAAHRALIALYSLHLLGEPRLPIARLARVLGEWSEALGQGELAQLAMLRRKHGRVALRTAVVDALDGAPPRAVRLVAAQPGEPRAGVFRVARDGRPDAEIEAVLAAQLGPLAIATGPLPRALLEARLHGATCVTTATPGERPVPWPRGAGLVLVLYGQPSAWIADVPAL